MKRSLLVLSALSGVLLTACSGNGPGNLRIHEVDLSGGTQQRLVWVYGNLNGSASSSVRLGGTAVDLRPQVQPAQDALALPGTLSVNGQATYRVNTDAVAPKLSGTALPGGGYSVQALNGASIAAIYYTDGVGWQKLSGVSGQVSGGEVGGLSGAGQLTDAEAQAISQQLRAQGPLMVAVLNDPTPGLKVEPTPTESLRTSLYILPVSKPVSSTTGSVSVSPNPTIPNPTSSSTISSSTAGFSELASGSNASETDTVVQVATTDAQARALYARAYGRQSNRPTPPQISGQTLVGLFLGQRNTGGYGVRVSGVSSQGGVLMVTAAVSSPKPGMMTAQALTSPWTLIAVPGTFSAVKVIDPSGQVQFR